MLGQLLTAKAAVLAVATALGVGSAAAAGALPAPVQHVASEAATHVGLTLPDPVPVIHETPHLRATPSTTLPTRPVHHETPVLPSTTLSEIHKPAGTPPKPIGDKPTLPRGPETPTAATLRLECHANASGVLCAWPAPAMGDGLVLLRTTEHGPGRVVWKGLARVGTFADTDVVSGVHYQYLLVALTGFDTTHTVAHSERIDVVAGGDAHGPTLPPQHEPSPSTTTTTKHHEEPPTSTTSTTQAAH